jgi:hypothetical protein
MSRINWRRVLLGGLLAGVIINVFEIVWSGMVLGKQWQAAMNALGHELPSAALWIFPLEALGMGIAAVWLYAAVRPRFGAGPSTAVLSGLGFWVIGYALPTVGIGQTGLFPARLLAITHLGGLVEIIAASVAGAWVYRE